MMLNKFRYGGNIDFHSTGNRQVPCFMSLRVDLLYYRSKLVDFGTFLQLFIPEVLHFS